MLKLLSSMLSLKSVMCPVRCYHVLCRLSPPVLTSSTSSHFTAMRCFSSSASKQSNHYQTLGLAENSSQSEIKSAYYKMSKIHHPDVSENPQSHVKFTKINEAYEILGDEKKRREYDQSLHGSSKHSYQSSWPTSSYSYHQWTSTYKQDFDFSYWQEEKKHQYSSKRKSTKSQSEDYDYSKYFYRKKGNNKDSHPKNTNWNDWFYETDKSKNYSNSKSRKKQHASSERSEKSYDELYWEQYVRDQSNVNAKKRVHNSNNSYSRKRNNHKQYQNDFSYKGGQKKAQDNGPDSQEEYYRNVFREHNRIKDEMNKDLKETYFSDRDLKLYEYLYHNYENIIKMIEMESSKRNRDEFLKQFLKNFYKRKRRKRNL